MSSTAGQTKNELIQSLNFQKYFHADSWSEYNKAFFDGLAPKYDWLNEIITLGQQRFYKRKVVMNAGLPFGAKVLDLCTGSGDLALFIAQCYPYADVIGADLSDVMLDIAKKKCKNYPEISFCKADALNLPFENESFDAVFVGFGLRNFADMRKGLKEIKRVLKKGGLFVNMDLSAPKKGIKKWLHHIYFEKTMPLMGKYIFHRSEFNSLAYLPASNKHFPKPDELIETFSEMGFSSIRRYDYMLGGISQQVAVKTE